MKTICIFGIFVADLCFFSHTIPIRGQTVLGTKHLVGPGGKGSNQAIAAARLGGNVNFITKLGVDNHADMALTLYKDSGMNTKAITQDPNLTTGVAGIMIDNKTGDNIINVVPGAAAHLDNQDIDKKIDLIKDSKIFLTQLETPPETTSYALNKAKNLGNITILNPAPAARIKDSDFKLIDFFTPNEKEAGFYLNKNIETNKDIEDAGNDLLKKGINNIVITLGSKGVYFVNAKEKYYVDAFKLKSEVVDTTGAGDAFNGAFAYALANEYKNKEALIFANKVAGISTTKLGAANSMPTIEEVNNY
jgi:ribokinase